MSTFKDQIELGSSGLSVSRMGIGADAGASSEAIEYAFERGINYFYWGSRRKSGMKKAIRNLAPRYREKMVIALQTYDYSGYALEHTFKRGLKQLKLDYADVFILGMRNKPVPPRIMETAISLKEQGLTRHLCISAHNRSMYRNHLAQNTFDLVMVRYNAAHRGAETDVFPLLETENPPGVICYNSTRWGHLFDPRWIPAGERVPTPVDLYRYVLTNPHVNMVLTAPENLQQMKDNLTTLDSEPVSAEEKSWLEKIGDHVHALNPSTNFDFVFQLRGPKK